MLVYGSEMWLCVIGEIFSAGDFLWYNV